MNRQERIWLHAEPDYLGAACNPYVTVIFDCLFPRYKVQYYKRFAYSAELDKGVIKKV